jgi:hypothetical protein
LCRYNALDIATALQDARGHRRRQGRVQRVNRLPVRERPPASQPEKDAARTGPTAATSPTQRDQHVLAVDAHGRTNWQKTTGYNRRSKVEASISRYKRVIGDTLKSREDARRVTEVAIAIKSLNRMRKLGQADFLRVA